MNIDHIKNSIYKAEKLQSKIDKDILDITGMSGVKNRHFLNNILSMKDLSYLEVGCWRGSTACSAMYKNDLHQCILIDNFSEFGEDFVKIDKEWDNGKTIRSDLLDNLKKFGCRNYKFVDSDFFSVNLSDYEKFDIFLYDGCHDFYNQSRAIAYSFNYLKNRFLFISDDYSMPIVKDATDKSINDIKRKVKLVLEIKIEREDPIKDNWWHGLYIGLFDKI